MDIYNEIRKIFKELGGSVDIVQLENNRKKFPEAGYMPESSNGHSVFVLKYNKPALMRWALWEIIIHEMAHKTLRDEGYENWKEHDDMFWKRYIELRKIFENKVARIYGR